MLFVVTAVNYADRATLSIAGSEVSKQLGLSKVVMGYAFSAFGWAYVIGQIPGGWLLDRFGSKRVYLWSIITWSIFTFLQGFIGYFEAAAAVVVLFALRFLLGLAEAPSFPGNGRIVAAWFPTAERGTASAIFNSAQYFATAMFAPITGWITYRFGWPYVFFVMGGHRRRSSRSSGSGRSTARRIIPRISAAELAHIESGGGLVDMDRDAKARLRGRRSEAILSRAAARQPDAARRLHRPVLHHDDHLLLPDLVSGLPRRAARHVDPARPAWRRRCRRSADFSAACSAASSRIAC